MRAADRAHTWNAYQPYTMPRKRTCGCGTETFWPEFGWSWRWKLIGQGTESRCAACLKTDELEVETFVTGFVPDRCPKCHGGPTDRDRAVPSRFYCRLCGWDTYLREGHVKPGSPKIFKGIFASLLVLLTAGVALAQGGTSFYVPIADVSVTALVAVKVCPTAGNRIGCGCRNNSTTINLRYGSAAVTPVSGEQFGPGAYGVFDAGSGVWMIAESGTVTVSCTDERK